MMRNRCRKQMSREAFTTKMRLNEVLIGKIESYGHNWENKLTDVCINWELSTKLRYKQNEKCQQRLRYINKKWQENQFKHRIWASFKLSFEGVKTVKRRSKTTSIQNNIDLTDKSSKGEKWCNFHFLTTTEIWAFFCTDIIYSSDGNFSRA